MSIESPWKALLHTPRTTKALVLMKHQKRGSSSLSRLGAVPSIHKPTDRAQTSSRFVSCPVCSAHVLKHSVNEHLDKCCLGNENQRGDAKTAPSTKLPQPDGEHAGYCTQQSRELSFEEVLRYQIAGDEEGVHAMDALIPGGARMKEGSKGGVQWWRDKPTDSQHVAFGRASGGPRSSKPVPLTAAQLREAVPCELIADVLPRELADSLLLVRIQIISLVCAAQRAIRLQQMLMHARIVAGAGCEIRGMAARYLVHVWQGA